MSVNIRSSDLRSNGVYLTFWTSFDERCIYAPRGETGSDRKVNLIGSEIALTDIYGHLWFYGSDPMRFTLPLEKGKTELPVIY